MNNLFFTPMALFFQEVLGKITLEGKENQTGEIAQPVIYVISVGSFSYLQKVEK